MRLDKVCLKKKFYAIQNHHFYVCLYTMNRSLAKLFMISILLLSSLMMSAQYRFEITADIEEAYGYAMSLRKKEATKKIEYIKVSDPQNLMVLHVENYLDFFEIFINEDESVFDKLEKNKERRLEQIEEAEVESPYSRFVRAEITLQWALARMKFNQRFAAAQEIYSAYNLLEKNVAIYPDFMLNKKSLSILHALAESLPGIVRKIFGVDGSIQQGTREINSLTKLDRDVASVFYDEITTIYAYILTFQNNKKYSAWTFIKGRDMDVKANPLACFVLANMAQKNGLNDKAIDILSNRPQGTEYENFYYLDFLLGKSKLYRLENGADEHIKKFIDNFEGEHFIKEAYQKLAWYELVMNNNFVAYKKYMEHCIDRGNDLVDEDKQAKREAKSNNVPHPDLLKARLLYDGGYYQRAYTLLITKAYLFQKGSHENIEYNYRMGRISQALNNLRDAIQHYGYVMNIGSKSKSYYACNAALQIGLIYESQNDFKKAKQYLKKCLKMDPDEYKNGLHQKAKSALERIDEKE